ncbi:hypothetical protein LSUB1_G007531 [Lachnellula subtilissima]|uniref:Uncharacterized protein n=1 Tax=Lachnellula subtilissima TaxID=602034 RepID=A0A8H8RAM2_9HELO|nr:hypothetical protein LSUB1_G007531 [Lachnellula subtilissima]
MPSSPDGHGGVVVRPVSPAQFSSASGLSSPPRSSPEPSSPSAQFANELSTHQNSSITVNPPGGVDGPSASKTEVVVAQPQPQPPARKKPDSSATNTDQTAAAPKTRKPRKPRDPNAPVRRRKNQSTEPAHAPEINAAPGPPPRQPPQPTVVGPVPSSNVIVRPDPVPSQNGKSEDIQRPINSFFTSAPPPPRQQPYQHQQPLPQTMPQTLRSSSSGQNYDPIRSNYDHVRETVVTHPPPPYNAQGSPSQSHSMNRASASPSISSLVDPPNQSLTSPSIAAQSFFNQQQRLHHEGHASVPPSPTVTRLAPGASVESSPKPPAPASMAPRKSDSHQVTLGSSAMSKKNSIGAGSTATSSAAASPKPPKAKEGKDVYPTPPPLPGSGLMHLGVWAVLLEMVLNSVLQRSF